MTSHDGFAVKVCTSCGGEPKMLTLFPRNRAAKDGRNAVCCKCRNERARERDEKRFPAAWMGFNPYVETTP